jgi:hypothetical protein
MSTHPALGLLLLVLFMRPIAAGEELTIHVAPDGDDTAAGRADTPLATLEGARRRVASIPSEDRRGPITVLFRGGVYPTSEPVVFGAADSGTSESPIRYQAVPDAEVVFTGGVALARWSPVTDEAVLSRLAEPARGTVRVADLQAAGVRDLGELHVRGFGMGTGPVEPELFHDQRPMQLARWPNDVFRRATGKTDVTHIQVDTDRLARWQAEADPWLMAYWHHDWAELFEPIVEIDADARTLVRSADIRPRYGISPSLARWYAFNLLSEIDQPGEYYIDRENARVYFWPPSPEGSTVLSQAEGFIRGDELSHVTFRGFTLEACRGTAIILRGGSDCHVVGCTIRNTGHAAVVVGGGERHEVYGCDIEHCGTQGIAMKGGDRPTLTPAGHNAENNHVRRFGRRKRTYAPGIRVDGVGNRIAHNLVHDCPHMALASGGNEHVVEFNEIHNAVRESGDAGAFYVGRDWTQRGNTIRFNYWHHIAGPVGYGGMTIYLDDQHCGYTIHGNLFERCARAVFIGGGDDNTVTGNVFLDCWKAAHIDDRGMRWQKAFTANPNGTLRTRLRAMPYKDEPWASRYPNLPGILDDQPNIPKRNVLRGNISAGGSWNDIYPAIAQYQTVEDNLVFDDDPDWVRVIRNASGHPVRLEFKDPAAVESIGFEPLPLEKMGLYDDPRRASWPVEHQVHPVKLPGSP